MLPVGAGMTLGRDVGSFRRPEFEGMHKRQILERCYNDVDLYACTI